MFWSVAFLHLLGVKALLAAWLLWRGHIRSTGAPAQ